MAQVDDLEEDEAPFVETARLLKESDTIAVSGALALVSLASLFIVVCGSLYKLVKWKMNKGYMVIVQKE